MGTRNKLKGVEDHLIKDLRETTLSFRSLGKEYGVTKQAISNFINRKWIARLKKPKKQEHTEKECPICQGLIKIARKPHSEFICYQTLSEQLGLQRKELRLHLSLLRSKKIVPQKFGKLISKRVELAYRIYFKRKLPVRTIGRQVGLKNFHSIIQKHKASGWDVPAPLFIYDGKERTIRHKRKRKP